MTGIFSDKGHSHERIHSFIDNILRRSSNHLLLLSLDSTVTGGKWSSLSVALSDWMFSPRTDVMSDQLRPWALVIKSGPQGPPVTNKI